MHHKTFKSNIGFPESGKDSDTFIDLDRLWAAVVRRANVIAASVIAAVFWPASIWCLRPPFTPR